jgi:hypothetical protein
VSTFKRPSQVPGKIEPLVVVVGDGESEVIGARNISGKTAPNKNGVTNHTKP